MRKPLSLGYSNTATKPSLPFNVTFNALAVGILNTFELKDGSSLPPPLKIIVPVLFLMKDKSNFNSFSISPYIESIVICL